MPNQDRSHQRDGGARSPLDRWITLRTMLSQALLDRLVADHPTPPARFAALRALIQSGIWDRAARLVTTAWVAEQIDALLRPDSLALRDQLRAAGVSDSGIARLALLRLRHRQASAALSQIAASSRRPA